MTYQIEYEALTDIGVSNYEEIIKKVVDGALDMEECPYECEVSITIVDNDEIQAINKEFRGIDNPTDVLSFPMVEYPAPAEFDFLEEEGDDCFNPETGELLLGDIILSAEKILEQAEKYGHSVVRELAFLTAHSMLHLMGYDHMEEDERAVMEEKQRLLMDRLGITR
ncbi:MAG: rRNA maturation RNase YbeY [Lachnospiraceae bacterium]|nr:rRNA maturation RNase YbeY [Lachnospiraceae bacterium]